MRKCDFASANRILLSTVCALIFSAAVASADVFNLPAGQTSVVMVPVGDPGNHYPVAINYTYNIDKYDVTAAQYAAFLNAVAKSDPYGLYDAHMSTEVLAAAGFPANYACGISRSGNDGSYTYTTTRDPNYPVNWVNAQDAARFCNWLSNGQPTGPEGNGTTETGSYNINGQVGSDDSLNIFRRTANANYVIPTDAEWFKAGYYNSKSTDTYSFPTQNNRAPSNVLSITGTNNANYSGSGAVLSYTDPVNFLTPVGAFAASPSPYGTFDQGGDVQQLVIYTGDYFHRIGLEWAGASFEVGDLFGPNAFSGPYVIDVEITADAGFRIAQVPEPDSLAIMGLGSIGIVTRRKHEVS